MSHPLEKWAVIFGLVSGLIAMVILYMGLDVNLSGIKTAGDTFSLVAFIGGLAIFVGSVTTIIVDRLIKTSR